MTKAFGVCAAVAIGLLLIYHFSEKNEEAPSEETSKSSAPPAPVPLSEGAEPPPAANPLGEKTGVKGQPKGRPRVVSVKKASCRERCKEQSGRDKRICLTACRQRVEKTRCREKCEALSESGEKASCSARCSASDTKGGANELKP